MPERRPFVDRTGLEGRYDVDFRFTIYNGPTTDRRRPDFRCSGKQWKTRWA